MDKEGLKRRLTERFQQTLAEALAAVDAAPDGRWIAASEWQVRDTFQRLTAECYQEMMQGRVDGLGARSAAGVGNAKPLAPARPGTDERFKEMKVGAFYDQRKRYRHAFATEATSGDYGPLLKAHARQVGFDRADETIPLVDGARWIATQVCAALVLLKALLLDFYHLSEHVYDAAKCCLGDTPAAAEWAAARLTEVKTTGAAPVLAAIDALNKQVRATAKRGSLRLLRAYLADRLDMLDYRTALANGWDIGSGPTEAECKTLTLRLKRPGARWDRDHAAAMTNLKALYESGQADLHWPDARKAAA